VGTSIGASLPSQNTAELWIYTTGLVQYWNASEWGQRGFAGDSRIKAVSNLAWGCEVFHHPGDYVNTQPPDAIS
jgi:hypothetical protein